MKYDFFLYRAFLENSLSKQNFPSPHMLAVCMQGEGESLSFFLRLAALCMALLKRIKILLGRWISGTGTPLQKSFEKVDVECKLRGVNDVKYGL